MLSFSSKPFFFASTLPGVSMRRLNFKTSFSSSLLPLCIALASTHAAAQAAYKVAEVERPRCDFSEVPQITDSPMTTFVEMNKEKDAKAAIIVYGMPGEAFRYAKGMKN